MGRDKKDEHRVSCVDIVRIDRLKFKVDKLELHTLIKIFRWILCVIEISYKVCIIMQMIIFVRSM